MIDFLIGVGSVVSALLLAAQMRERGRSDLFWSRVWFALVLLSFVGYLLARSGSELIGFTSALIYTTALVALYPVQYLHIRAVTGAPARILWPHMIAPGFNILMIAGLQLLAGSRMDLGMLSIEGGPLPYINYLTMFIVAALAAYPFLSVRRLLNARKTTAFRLGSRAATRFDWLIAWCGATFLLVLGGWVTDIGSQLGVISITAVAWVTFGSLAIQLVLVGFFVTGNDRAFSPLPDTSRCEEQIDLEALTSHLRAHKPYLKPGLSAEMLAEPLGWPLARLTQAIRSAGAAHFNDYLNRWRVEDVIAQMKAGTAANLLDLALEAGFGSKSSFNEAFKRHTGLTPTEYRRRLKTSG